MQAVFLLGQQPYNSHIFNIRFYLEFLISIFVFSFLSLNFSPYQPQKRVNGHNININININIKAIPPTSFDSPSKKKRLRGSEY